MLPGSSLREGPLSVLPVKPRKPDSGSGFTKVVEHSRVLIFQTCFKPAFKHVKKLYKVLVWGIVKRVLGGGISPYNKL